MRFPAIISLCDVIAMQVCLAQDINLNGTVKNASGAALKGVVVALVQQGIADTTDDGGGFSIVKQNVSLRGRDIRRRSMDASVRNGMLEFSVGNNQSVVAVITDAKGSTVHRSFLGNPLPGINRIPLHSAPVSSGVYQIQIRQGDVVWTDRVVLLGRVYAHYAGVPTQPAGRRMAKASAGTVDTLVFSRADLTTLRLPVTSYAGTHDVTMSPKSSAKIPAVRDLSTVARQGPSLSLPAYLGSVSETTFGTTITRVGQAVNEAHHYSKTQPWNADMSLFALGGSGYLCDAKTYQKIGTIDDGAWGSTRRWSNIDPEIMYSCAGQKFYRYNVNTKQLTLVKDYSAEPSPLTIGLNEGMLSNDDHTIVLCGAEAKAFVVDPTTGEEIARMNLPADIDWIGCSQSGNWVVESAGGTHKVFTRTLSPAGDVGPGGHADMGMDAAGNEYLCVVDIADDCLYKSLLPNGAQQKILQFPCGISGHVSAQNRQRPGYVYFSGRKASSDFCDLVCSASLDGTMSTTHSEVFCYTRTVGDVYEHTARGCVSPDGSKVAFYSSFMGSNAYGFVVEIK